jgi:hypothetical protein
MKTWALTVGISFTFLILYSCSENNLSSPSTSEHYLYKSYDSTGALIAEGEFTIHHQETGEITGNWNFRERGNHRNCGPQVGNGNLIGGIEDSIMWINLNPNFADNNCYLYGYRNQNMYTGEWQWITFAGITNKGNFTASLK